MKEEDLEPCTKLIAYCFVWGEPITVLQNLTEEESYNFALPFTKLGVETGLSLKVNLRETG